MENKATDLPKDSVLKLTPNSGFIGQPQQTELGIKAKCLLLPQIKVERCVQVDNQWVQERQITLGSLQTKLDPQGIYKIAKVTYTGDNRGSDWYAEFEAMSHSGYLPALLDVPIVLPRAGDYILTLPVQAGDECLVIFADQCIDAWWQNGGVQNPMERRRHDLSDGFAILGTWSQPRRLAKFSTDTMQLLNHKTGAGITVHEAGITVHGTITVTGDAALQGAVVAGGVDLVGHTHLCPDGQTGGPQ